MISKRKDKRGKLSNEILGLSGAAFAVSIFLFEFLYFSAIAITVNYQEIKGVYFTEMQTITMEMWIQNLSLVISVIFFITLFLFLVGQKISYLKEIIKGVEALQAHQMDFVMPMEGNNELTELAESINYLAETERKIKQREKELGEEKEQLIRTLSHDIRTPLTSIMACSEYLEQKEICSQQEMRDYIGLVQRKAKQMKELTDILLDGGQRNTEVIEDGRFLMEQFIAEWEEGLEESYDCRTNFQECPKFSCELDVEEFRRIFDNLSSNIKKYANSAKPVEMKLFLQDKYLVIEQRNYVCTEIKSVESSKLGLVSIRRIVQNYGGEMEYFTNESVFLIRMKLAVVKSVNL